MIKTLFLGSNWESEKILKAIHEDPRFEIIGIITQEDKPVGRKQILTPTPVKTFGEKEGIRLFHTNSSEEKYAQALDLFKPELIVCVAFGEIIPEFFLEYPKYKAINVHFSLLPKYRGAVPIQMAILNGEKETGIAFVQMVKELDAGPILKMVKEKIKTDDTNLTLRERLVEISAQNLPQTLIDWTSGSIETIKQDEDKVSFCFKKDIEKEKAEVKFGEMEATYIDRMVRAFIPWPVAWAILDGKRVKIYKVKVVENEENGKLIFKTINGYIEILELQQEGKNVMSAKDYLSGRK